MNHVFAFVMAGGSGERFWPMSRQATPKHLLRLIEERTLLEATVSRLQGVVPSDRIFVLTNSAQMEAVRAVLPDIAPGQIIAEPAKRDTAPACALATAVARSIDPAATCLVLPADAMIHDIGTFQRQLRDAICIAGREEAIVSLGVPPAFPSTGFGYLETGDELPDGPEGSRVRTLKRFVEKPDLENAKAYLQAGHFFWNAGIFLWQAGTFLKEARRQTPALADFIESIPLLDELPAHLAKHFPSLPKISVDYAIMEHASRVVAVLSEFDWDDVGAWTALPPHLGSDESGNSARGPVIQQDARRNIAISNGRLIALCGVEDLVVVETPDAILVCHRDAVQNVKALQPLLPETLR